MCLNNIKCVEDSQGDAVAHSLSNCFSSDLGNVTNICAFTEVCNINQFGNLSVLHLNIRSLQKHFDELQELLLSLKQKQIFVDVILLCETWINDDANDALIDLDGYELFLHNRTRCKGGGIPIYVKHELKPSKRPDLNVLREGIFESLVVEINLSRKKAFVCELYRVPGTNESLFNEDIEKILRISKEGLLFIGSDQNLNLLKHQSHGHTGMFLNQILGNGLIPTILKPTRVTHRSSTLIDNIYIPINFENNFNSSVIINDMSDHFPCLTQIRVNSGKQNKREPVMINTRKINENKIFKINNDLLHKDWIKILDPHNSTDCNYETLTSEILGSIERNAPLLTKQIYPKNQIQVPWMSPNLLKCSKKCKRLYKASIGCQKTELNYNRYKQYSKALTVIKRKAKADYYHETIKSYEGNCKKIWGLLNKLIGKQNNKLCIIDKLNTNNGEITDIQMICDELNCHFSTVGHKVSGKTEPSRYMKYLSNRVEETLVFSPVTENEVTRLIEKLPNKKSSGHDGINNVLVKSLKFSLRLPLTLILNQSLMCGEFPKLMKLARVQALFKKGDKLEKDNYRPISLLVIFSKLLERAVNNRLVSFLEAHDIINESQYGFRKHHSTTHAIQDFVSMVLTGFEKNFQTLAVFIDLRKCFDSCQHGIILDKLEHYGIRGVTLEWFNSYLSGRSQFVQLSTNIKSSPQDVTIGTPQGSILGPLLTLIMLNDIKKSLKLSDCILFADDTTILVQGRNLKFLYTKMQRELDTLSIWFSDNGLSLNTDKTKSMLLSPKNFCHTENLDLMIGKMKLEGVDYFNLLGVTIDNHLSFEKHVTNLSTRLNRFKFLVRKFSRILPVHCLRNLYFAFVHSILTYGISAWGGLLSVNLFNQLMALQRSFIRIINKKSPLQEASPLFLRNKILKLDDVLKLELITIGHQYEKHLLPKRISRIFIERRHGYVTRCVGSPSVPQHKTSLFNKSFINKVPSIWEEHRHLFDRVSTKQSVKKVFKYYCFEKY